MAALYPGWARDAIFDYASNASQARAGGDLVSDTRLQIEFAQMPHASKVELFVQVDASDPR